MSEKSTIESEVPNRREGVTKCVEAVRHGGMSQRAR